MIRTGSAILQGKRQNQEDALVVHDLPGIGLLLAVADGLGGHQNGELASAAAVGALPAAVEQYLGSHGWERVFEEVDRFVCEAWGHTTLTVALLWEGRWTVAWCGDSPAIIARRNGKRLEQAFSAEAHGYGNWVARCLGPVTSSDVDRWKPQVETGELRAGDVVLVCSDGLDVLLDEGEAAKTLARLSKNKLDELDAVAERICQHAIDRGSRDNCTAVLAVYGEES